MHHTSTIDPETNKSVIIVDYNATKGGLDALDEKCTVYSTNRRTRRWPMAIFFQLVNISMVNSYVIWSAHPGCQQDNRAKWTKTLAMKLVEGHMRRRLYNTHVPRLIRHRIAEILDEDVPRPTYVKLQKKTRCGKCPRKKDMKTVTVCHL